jgi:polysaccharide deacetylase 2 family uncharacterized protein YibQ
LIRKTFTKRYNGKNKASAIAGLLLFVVVLQAEAAGKPRIAIIIDDLGYALSLGRRVNELPGPISIAVLPATPRGKLLAEEAYAAGKDVLLHLPLEAIHEDGWVEPGGISLDMSRGEFSRTFAEDIRSVPHVIGVNSHRGSLLTRHPGHMAWLMEEITKRGDLIFVDSYTTHESIALRLAQESGVPAVKRDVFLDPDQSRETVVREFARLKKLARQNGLAVGIGHPYPTTIELLERELPGLAAEGIELISISELVRLKTGRADIETFGHRQKEGIDGLLR